MIVSITGPGDPHWRGGPSTPLIRWILDHAAVAGTTRYWRHVGTWQKLESDADFAALNLALDRIRPFAMV